MQVNAMVERRASPRVPMVFLLRDAATENGEWQVREGDVGLGGMYWRGTTAPHGTQVDVRFHLFDNTVEVRAVGEIIKMKDAGRNIDFHVRFIEIDTAGELALAKYLDEWVARNR